MVKQAGIFDLKTLKKESTKQFSLDVKNPELIKKLEFILLSNRKQKYSNDSLAGLKKVVSKNKKGSGRARVQRLKSGLARENPNVIGGRRAHPPKIEKEIKKKMNKKEKKQAVRSLFSELEFQNNLMLKEEKKAVLFSDSFFEQIETRAEILSFFEKFYPQEVSQKKKLRAGKGKMRNRKFQNLKKIHFFVPSSLKQEPKLKLLSNFSFLKLIFVSSFNPLSFFKTNLGKRMIFLASSFEFLQKKYGFY